MHPLRLLVELDGNLKIVIYILQERFAETGLDASLMDSLWEVNLVCIHIDFVTYVRKCSCREYIEVQCRERVHHCVGFPSLTFVVECVPTICI